MFALDKNFAVVKTLGEGGFGVVFLAQQGAARDVSQQNSFDRAGALRNHLYFADYRQLAAIKQITTKGNADIKTLCQKEIKVLRDLRHVNAVRFFDNDVTDTIVSIAMEYCSRGDLRSVLDQSLNDR